MITSFLTSISPPLVSVRSARRFLYSRQGLLVSITVQNSEILLSPLSENDQLSFFDLFPPLLDFTNLFKTSGEVHFPPLTLYHWWAHMSRSLILRSLEHHWRIIRQSSSPLVSSQTCRCQTHVPTDKLFRLNAAVLPPLMAIRHCICKALAASETISSTVVRPDYCMSSLTGTKV
ncbi:hypothetical protein TNCV_2076551 [Trichonephila clavipes]|nr:hypothetical protein TNCV_2076551 [Trichonephila clavipes]